MKGLKIVATGRFAPQKVVTNEDLSKIVDTSDEWIHARTGMKKRHFCDTDDSNLSNAVAAATTALDKAGITPEEIGAVVVATFSGDYFVPSTACLVQKSLQLPDDIICFDLNAACSGFMYGLEVVRGLLLQSEKPYALLIGSEVISRRLDMTDRGTCILFGDGAGAALLTLDENASYTSIMGSHGDETLIYCPNQEGVPHKVHMDGHATYKFAVRTVPELIRNTAQKAELKLEELDGFILHQANVRIIESVAKTLELPMEKFFVNIEEYGNTSAASVIIALDEALERGWCKAGQKIMLVGFGAGKTWGAAILDI